MPPKGKEKDKRPLPKWDIEQVLKPVKKLRATMGATAKEKRSLDDIGMSGVTKEVVAMERHGVRAEIERIALESVASIMRGDGYSFTMPARTSSNMVYVAELDRLVLKDKTLERIFANASSARKTAITTRVLQLVLELCNRGIHVTKRDLFYTDVKLFKQQTESDDVLDDAACMIGCTRSSLNVVASEKGIVVGKLIFDDDGDTIDCTKMGVGGKAIPPSIDRVTNVRGDAQFILLIEKDAAFMRLAEDRFYNQYPCVIISGKGQPDVATRLFLNKVRSSPRRRAAPSPCPPRAAPSPCPPRAAPSPCPPPARSTAPFHPLGPSPDPLKPARPNPGAVRPERAYPRPVRRRPVRPQDPLRLHEGFEEHVVRRHQPDDARHQVARRAAERPREVQHPAAVPARDVGA